MTGWGIAAVLVLVLLGGWLWWTADRLDRLHHRLDLATAALRTQLARRIAAVLEVAGSGVLDDAEALLLLEAAHTAAHAADATDPLREESLQDPAVLAAQSELSQALRAVFDQPYDRPAEQFADLASCCRKVELARRFHNDQVASVRAVRDLRRVRWFGLAGRAPQPRTVDLDDGLPVAF